MGAAKRAKINPRKLAEQIVAETDLSDLASNVEIAGPGFLNFSLSDEFLSNCLNLKELIEVEHSPLRVVLDYSSPNLAKEMHVGHLRSTVIGDAMARILELKGHDVIRQNHIGDWGTAFGRVLAYLDELNDSEQADRLRDVEALYVDASQRFENDSEFADKSREMVLALQSGDDAALAKWRYFMDVANAHMTDLYERLGVSLRPEHVRGESSYNVLIPSMIENLQSQSDLLVESDGALCIFMDQFKTKDGEVQPLIVRKSDGGYLYHTTDLAALSYRIGELHADRVIYFTDTRQNLHFEMLFEAARLTGIAPSNVRLEHHPFGAVLGTDGKPFKTRSGGNVLLRDLIDEAMRRASALVEQKSQSLDSQSRDTVSKAIAMGALKYADLSKNRLHDYTFDWDEMLAFDGNTAPYLQYALARIHSIFRRGGIDMNECDADSSIQTPQEHQLAVQLLRFTEVINQVVLDVKPHLLCSYLYELTTRFMRFYEECPILNQPDSIESSRLAICRRTAETLNVGLNALGIPTLERM